VTVAVILAGVAVPVVAGAGAEARGRTRSVDAQWIDTILRKGASVANLLYPHPMRNDARRLMKMRNIPDDLPEQMIKI
jgi:hypothetical protein